jgi:hypothetical protein
MVTRILATVAVFVLATLPATGCSAERLLGPEAPFDGVATATAAVPLPEASSHSAPSENSCWGQATRVFARMGLMGDHASGFETPRLGLRNLARALHDQGIIDEDSMRALGAFVADELGLSIEACQ